MLKTIAISFVTMMTLFAAFPTRAEPGSPQVPQTEDVYLSTLRKMISEWNQGTSLSKSGLDEAFGIRVEPVLRNRSERPYFDFENKVWYEERVIEWKGLPNPLRSTKKLSEEAALLLQILYRNNLSSFSQEISANEAAIRDALRLPWFTILGIAQRRAKATITTDDIVFAAAMYFTGIWPFCAKSSLR